MERKDQRNETRDRPDKKDWITPEILDSPVITVTEGTTGRGSDQDFYS